MKRAVLGGHILLIFMLFTACTVVAPTPAPRQKVAVVIDAGSENDKSFNEYTLKGAQRAAVESGLDFIYRTPQSSVDYERAVISLIEEDDPDLVITVGFRMGDATAKAARKYPQVRFVIIDNAYFPGTGCQETVEDCYTTEGGLSNVTSLTFAEDQIGYLAGVLAACMSATGTIASLAGVEIPPVLRFVTGYQNGARSVKANIVTLNQHIPDFNDPATGKVIAQDFISQGADVIFTAAGNTGNGGLLAAKEAGIMAIGVDVDQFLAYPEVREVLLSSASKNVDHAASAAVKDFAAGRLESGVRLSTLANDGIGLSPYHDWENKIPQACKDQVEAAKAALITDPSLTGAK